MKKFKKSFIHLLLPFLTIPLYAQENQEPLLFQTILYHGSEETPLDSTKYIYNEKGQLIRQASIFFESSEKDRSIGSYEYDNQGNPTISSKLDYKNGVPISGIRRTETYNDQGLLIKKVIELKEIGPFYKSHQVLYTYDAQNKISTSVEQDWQYDESLLTTILKNTVKDTFAYNGDNIIYSGHLTWENNQWKNILSTQSNYDENNLLIYWSKNECFDLNCQGKFREDFYSYNEAQQLIRYFRKIISNGQLKDSLIVESIYNEAQIKKYEKEIHWNKTDYDIPKICTSIKESFFSNRGQLDSSQTNSFENNQLVQFVEKVLEEHSDDKQLNYLTFESLPPDTIRYLREVEKLKFDENGNQIFRHQWKFKLNGDTTYVLKDSSVFDVQNRLIFQEELTSFEGTTPNEIQYIYEINEKDQPILVQYNRRNDDNEWKKVYSKTYFYDLNDYLLKTISYESHGYFDNFTSYDDLYTINLYQIPLSVATEEIGENDYNLFPNPARKEVVFQITPNHLPINIHLFDVLGKQILTKEIHQPISTIEFPFLPNGIYFLNLNHQNQSAIKKIIIQH